MIIDETDPNKIKLLLDKINNNPTGISRLLADFTEIDIFSNSWPLAVDPLLISDGSIEDQTMRAETIVDVILPPLENKKFLDFGCGEGYVTKVAAKVAALAMGYDIKTKEDDFLTTSFEKVTKAAPFDVILIFDVLDHLEGSDPISILKALKGLLKPNTGRIYARLHPWTSKHANHAYRTFNKAFSHMFLTEQEIRDLGHEVLPVYKTLQPIVTYEEWIKEAELKIISKEFLKEPIDSLFKQPKFANVIKGHWKTSNINVFSSGDKFPVFQTELQFVDYILS